jgi:hypothetical protein
MPHEVTITTGEQKLLAIAMALAYEYLNLNVKNKIERSLLIRVVAKLVLKLDIEELYNDAADKVRFRKLLVENLDTILE